MLQYASASSGWKFARVTMPTVRPRPSRPASYSGVTWYWLAKSPTVNWPGMPDAVDAVDPDRGDAAAGCAIAGASTEPVCALEWNIGSVLNPPTAITRSRSTSGICGPCIGRRKCRPFGVTKSCMSTVNARWNASTVPLAWITRRSASTSVTVIPKPFRYRVIVAISPGLGANSAANSRTERKRWNVGSPGAWVRATNRSSRSGCLSLRISDEVTISAGGVAPTSWASGCAMAPARAAGALPSTASAAAAVARTAGGEMERTRRDMNPPGRDQVRSHFTRGGRAGQRQGSANPLTTRASRSTLCFERTGVLTARREYTTRTTARRGARRAG